MADVRIKALKNGPYERAGGAKVLAYTGKEYAESQIDPLYLCRCGASKNKPFCDGSHKDIAFEAEEMASWKGLSPNTPLLHHSNGRRLVGWSIGVLE